MIFSNHGVIDRGRTKKLETVEVFIFEENNKYKKKCFNIYHLNDYLLIKISLLIFHCFLKSKGVSS